MVHRFAVLLASAVIACGLSVAVAPHARAFFTCSEASGYVRDTAGHPLAGAEVSVEQGSEYCYSPPAMTDGTGHYRVQVGGAVSGQGRATAIASGHAPQSKSVHSRPAIPSGLPVIPGSNDFALSPA